MRYAKLSTPAFPVGITTMLPRLYNRLTTCVYLLMNLAGYVYGDCSHFHTVNYELRSFRSPHQSNSRGEVCRYILSAPVHYEHVYMKIYFPDLNPLPYHICMGSYIDIFDGPDVTHPILGRYCDMNSTVIQSSGPQLTIISSSSGSKFDFQILYCLDPFNKSDPIPLFKKPSSKESTLPTLQVAAICIAVFLFLFITGCLVHTFIKRRKRNSHEDTREVTREEREDTQEDRYDNSNVIYASEPPAYWSVCGSAGEVDNDDPARASLEPSGNTNRGYETDPPPYWSVYASNSPRAEDVSGSPQSNLNNSH